MTNNKLTEIQKKLEAKKKLIAIHEQEAANLAAELKLAEEKLNNAKAETLTTHDRASVFKFMDYIINNGIEKYIDSRNDVLHHTPKQPLLWNGWTLEVEEMYGGGEGDGEEHWVVLKMTDPKGGASYWYVPGYYQSYNGGELEINSMYQCIPYTVEVTKYKKF